MSASCKNPLSDEVLADYWLGEVSPEIEERAEEHLLACDVCSRNLERIMTLIEGIRDLTRKGLLRVVVSEAFLEKLSDEGLNLRQYRVNPGGGVDCTITENDDLVIARLAADMHSARRVDLLRCDDEGRELARIKDIPLVGSRNEVLLSEPTDFLRGLTNEVMHLRLLAVEEAQERVLGDYTFRHYASPRP